MKSTEAAPEALPAEPAASMPIARPPRFRIWTGALFVLLPWSLGRLTDFAQRILLNLGRLGGGT